MKKTFEQWLADVNAELEKDGFHLDILPDVPTLRWYDEGVSAKKAASKALKAAHN